MFFKCSLSVCLGLEKKVSSFWVHIFEIDIIQNIGSRLIKIKKYIVKYKEPILVINTLRV